MRTGGHVYPRSGDRMYGLGISSLSDNAARSSRIDYSEQ